MLDITKDIQSLTTFRRRSGDFMKQLNKELSAEPNTDEVYQLNLQFFPLTGNEETP